MNHNFHAVTALLLLAALPQALRAQDPADAAWAAGEHDRARELYAQRVTADSNDVRALHRLALLRSWNSEYAPAIQLFDRVTAMIGLSAFLVEDVSAFMWIYQKLAFLFGGMLIPLDFYPDWLQVIARALPFASMTYGPARLFVTPTVGLFLSVMTLQIVWIVILALLLTFAYRRGVAYLTVNGG